MKNLKYKLQKFYLSKAFIWLLFAVGILLRLRQYLFNRSLCIDEAAVAVNLVGRSWAQLFELMLYGQVAPFESFAKGTAGLKASDTAVDLYDLSRPWKERDQ